MKKYFLLSTLLFQLVSAAWGKDNYQQFNDLFKAKKYEDLRGACQERLKTHPKSLDAYYFLSLVNLNEGKGDAAVSSMMNFEKYHNEAEKLQSSKDGGAGLLIEPFYTDLYYVLGQYYLRQKQYDRALPWLTRARSHYSEDPMLQFLLGRCYGGQKDYPDAVKAFQKQYQLEPKDPSPLYNIASCYGEQGKSIEAVRWLKKAVAAYPKFKEQASQDASFDKIKGSKAFKDMTAH